MKVFAIVSSQLELLKSLIDIEVLNVRSCYTNIIWTQEVENKCLLHDVYMYKALQPFS
jgi:hypothetical protein